MISYKYMSAYCGAGKTHLLANAALRMTRGENKIAIVQPTHALVEQTYDAYFAGKSHVRTITSKTHPDVVIASIKAHLETTDPETPEVLLITHSAFLGLSYWHNAKNWTLFVDEVPPVEQFFSLQIPRSHAVLTEHLDVNKDTGMEQFWQVMASSSLIEEMAHNREDDALWKPLSPVARTLVSPRYQTYVHAQSYEELVNTEPNKPGKQPLAMSSILSPTTFTGFNDVIFFGACFEDSLLHLIWSRMRDPILRVEFKDASAEMNQFGDLRYQHHTNGHLLDIYYALDCPWSKRIRDQVVTFADGSTGTVFEALTNAAKTIFGSEPVAHHINNDVDDAVAGVAYERLPNTSHGLNTYQHLHNAFLVQAINPPSRHFRFLAHFADITPDELQTALTRQSTYQALCRTSARNPDDKNRKKVIVPDLKTAEYLGSIFEGATLHVLKLFSEDDEQTKALLSPSRWRATLYDDGAHKQRAYNERHRLIERERLARHHRLDAIQDRGRQYGFPTKFIGRREQAKIKAEVVTSGMMAVQMHNKNLDTSIFVDGIQGSIFENGRFDNIAKPLEGPFDGLVDLLRTYSTLQVDDKTKLAAFSPARYIAGNGLTQKKKGNENLVFAKNIGLDFDGGDMEPDEFAATFPGWRMCIYSTFSSKPEAKRWRIIIETDDVLDYDSYKVVTKYILERLNDAGYYGKKQVMDDITIRRRASKPFKGLHGCDESKLGPTCVLFVPGGRPNSFFLDYDTGRIPLSVYDLVVNNARVDLPSEIELAEMTRTKTTTKAPPKPVVSKTPSTPRADRLQVAHDKWHRDGDHDGHRHRGFFDLGRDLMNAGLDAAAISSEMTKAASLSRVSRELVPRIPEIISNLRPLS